MKEGVAPVSVDMWTPNPRLIREGLGPEQKVCRTSICDAQVSLTTDTQVMKNCCCSEGVWGCQPTRKQRFPVVALRAAAPGTQPHGAQSGARQAWPGKVVGGFLFSRL